MTGLTYLDANSWRYENYGTADLLSISGTTLTNLPTTQAKTCSAFYQTTRDRCFDLPATGEVWIKFDVYFNGKNRWRAYNGGSNGFSGITSQTNLDLSFFSNSEHVDGYGGTNGFQNICELNQLQTFLLHMIRGSSAGLIEAWVDGSKIYTYEGDVNHGQDFSDIYLQSDGSGTFFSNVIISNVQIGFNENIATYNIEFKPEIYILWIPTGQVLFKPLIFASYIPAPEKVSADLSRNVSKAESSTADLFRRVKQNENATADFSRYVIDSEKSSADTNRKISRPENISVDILRRVVQAAETVADTFRHVKDTQKTLADISRKIGITITNVDTKRNIIVSTKNSFDTFRQIGEAKKSVADLYLRTARTEKAEADSLRAISVSTNITADTLRKVGVVEKFSADTPRLIGVTEKTSADTFRLTTTFETATADLNRALREITRADTRRVLRRAEKTIASTVIRVPHVLNYVLKNRTRTLKTRSDDNSSIVTTFKDYGVTAINITLNEKTLSDDFRFDIAARTMEINEAVQGILLDYPFRFLVEETKQTDLIQSVKGRYNVDDLLYKWFLLSLDSDDNNFPPAAWIANEIAHYFLLEPDVRIDDFIPTNFNVDTMMTYSDVLNNAFGWTSRLPHRQINIFIRGNKLHCIQRGKENSVFDITNLPHSRPTVNKKLNRVLVHNPNKDNDNNTDDNDNNTDDDDNYYKFSGTISYSTPESYMAYTYSEGLLTNEVSQIKLPNLTNRSSTTYDYFTHDGAQYINYKVTSAFSKEIDADGNIICTETYSVTSYGYKTVGDEFYLFHESEQSTKEEYELTALGSKPFDTEKTKEIRDTYHVPVGNGWYAQSVYLNGVFQGANLSQGKPGNSVSPYTVKCTQNALQHLDLKQPEFPQIDFDDDLTAIVDDSFPVKESEFKNRLNADLRWLHRKIVETVSVDLVAKVDNGVPSINHIVDFTERIKFNDAEYFLVSNNISFTPRKFIQKLQLIRWY